VVALVGCGKKGWVSDPSDPNNVKIEAAIRKFTRKPTGELTKADLEKVTFLNLGENNLTEVTGLEQLTLLELTGTKVTKAGLAKLKKALPRCRIYSNPTK
jgi:hypothetical protein